MQPPQVDPTLPETDDRQLVTGGSQGLASANDRHATAFHSYCFRSPRERHAFVGRRAELDRLEAYRAEAEAGRPAMVIVQAAPGFGKTALLTEFGLSLTGWHYVDAAGDEGEARLPFGLLDRLGKAMRPGASIDGPRDPFTEGASFLQWLGDLEESGPVAVVVDDAQWADLPSLLALTFALRRLRVDRVLTVLALRAEDAYRLPTGLVRLVQDRGARVELSGLSPDEIRNLGVAMGHGRPTRRIAEQLHKHTGGSPLYLTALLAETPPGAFRRRRHLLPAPRSFGFQVRAALEARSRQCRRLVEAAAVLGMHCALGLAASVGEVTDPLTALQDAQGTGLIDAVHDADGWAIAFRHPIARAAVLDLLAGVSGLHSLSACFPLW